MPHECPDCRRVCECLEGDERRETCWHCADDHAPRLRRLTRQEQLEALADRGVDTWEEYRGER